VGKPLQARPRTVDLRPAGEGWLPGSFYHQLQARQAALNHPAEGGCPKAGDAYARWWKFVEESEEKVLIRIFCSTLALETLAASSVNASERRNNEGVIPLLVENILMTGWRWRTP
jgi:hypothetical protein